MAEQAASGLDQQAFCRSRGLSTSAFYNAKSRLRAAPVSRRGPSASEFVAVALEPQDRGHDTTTAWEVELSLGAGVVLRVRGR